MGKVILFSNKGAQKMNIKRADIRDVANACLSFQEMTHKKLQKLCYYVEAWHLALFGETLTDEYFQAWVHGPVSPVLYQEYKGYGWDKISTRSMPEEIQRDGELLELIRNVIRIYGDLNGDELENLTHDEDPWQQARKDLKPWEGSSNKIDRGLITSFYREQLKGENSDV